VVIAADPVTAERLAPGCGRDPSAMRAVTTFWHRAPVPPIDEPILLLDGEEALVVNSVVMSNVSSAYRPADQAGSLVATSVLGRHDDPETERAVRLRLATLYGAPTGSWELLAAHAIERALPGFPPGTPLRRPVRLDEGRYVCGDHRDTPSIQGALVSGRRAADAVAADLGVRGATRSVA
jgi:hypothetical protein